METPFRLIPSEELQLQQLRQMDFWRHYLSRRAGETADHSAENKSAEAEIRLPERWELTRGLMLADWQRRCMSAWLANGKRGIVKVVTGAGKTILALGIIERLQQGEMPQLRVAIVVPTVVLLHQWRDELLEHSNLPRRSVGFLGGGVEDHFDETTRILVCVLNSASKKLAQEVEQAGVANDLLLIVDECHRAGAAEMKKVFQTRRTFSLGLSATPERDQDAPESSDLLDVDSKFEQPQSFDETILGRELGSIIFEMNYADAIQAGILPPFRVVHYGLSLESKESERYERISREIKELREELETINRRGLALVRWCRSKAGAQNPKAVRFVALTTERKRLLYKIKERRSAVLAILQTVFSENPDARAILFHESIEEVMNLFEVLREHGYPAVAEHSDFPDQMRSESLRLFRTGLARIIVSAKSLIEGFNVPSADVGIIVAASSSVRQRVQTLGRLLRRSIRKDGSEKEATLYVLYASKTVDEMIYEKANWETFIGADRNEYFVWTDVRDTQPQPRPGPPRSPLAEEEAVDTSDLHPGETYPGNPERGRIFSLDTQGTIRDENGTLIKPHAQLMSLLGKYRKASGRFRVTCSKRYVLKLERTNDGWRHVYLGKLDSPVETADIGTSDQLASREYEPGEPYPLAKARGTTFSVLQRDRRLIARKTPSGVKFVIPPEQLEDDGKRMALRSIQQGLAELHARGKRINKMLVTEEGDAVYVMEGQAYFLGKAPEGSLGFVFE